MSQFPHAVRYGATQSAAFSTTAGTIAAAIGNGVSRARVVATAAAFVAVGKTPTATTSDVYLPANVLEYVLINPGEKVSAIQAGSAGTLYVTEIP
jgi:hypothetical protein